MMRYFKRSKNIARAFAGAWLGVFGVGMMSDTALARTNDGKVFGQVRGDESFSQMPRKPDYKGMPYVPGKAWLMINGTEPGKSIPGQVVRVIQQMTGQQLIKIKDPDQPGVFYTDVTIDPQHPFMEDPSIGLVKGTLGMKPFHGTMEDEAKEELAKLLAMVDAENNAGRIAAVVKPSIMPATMVAAAAPVKRALAPAVKKPQQPVQPVVIDFASVLPKPPVLVAPVIRPHLEDVVQPPVTDIPDAGAQYARNAFIDRAVASQKVREEDAVRNIDDAKSLAAVQEGWEKKPKNKIFAGIASIFGLTSNDNSSWTAKDAGMEALLPVSTVTRTAARTQTMASATPPTQRTPMNVQNSSKDPARTDEPNPRLKDIFVEAVTKVTRTIVNKEIAFAQYKLSNGDTYQIAPDSCIADGCLRAYKAVAKGNFEWVDLRKDEMLKDLHDKLLEGYKARNSNQQILAA